MGNVWKYRRYCPVGVPLFSRSGMEAGAGGRVTV